MNKHLSPPIRTSRLDAEAFLNAIAPGEKSFTFQTFGDGKCRSRRSELARVLHGTLAEHWPTLSALSSRGAGIFVTVNRTNLQGRSKTDITGVRALFVDLDGADPMNVERLRLKASCGAETSPGRFHFYWRVKGVSLDEFSLLQKRLAILMDGDMSVCDLPRVMRPPGFVHQKREPFMVSIFLPPEPFVYARDEFVAALEDAERLHGVAPVFNVAQSKLANLEIAPTSAQRVYSPEEEENLRSALAFIPCGDRATWFKIGAALHATGWSEKARSLWDDWSRQSTKFDPDDQEKTWTGFERYNGTPVSVATIFHMARERGWQEPLGGVPAHGLSEAPEAGPEFVSWGDFAMTAKGLMKPKTKASKQDDNAEQGVEWISAPFEILGACRDPKGRAWGKSLRWRDADGRVHHQHVTDAALQGEAGALCAMLASDGLRISRGQQRAFANYLSGARVEGRVTVVSRTGWHEIGGQLVFVLADDTIGPRDAERAILDAAATGPYEARGSLDDWKKGVGALASGHALPVLVISAALAGPLLHLAGQEGGGLNIFGGSSRGKTTILQAAASAWGRGGSPGYVRAWRATANGLEGAAASASDTALVLDELGVLEARDAAAALYSLANGAGKARAARDGSLREPKSWRVLILSTGEVPIETKLAEDKNRKARAGQLVRMLDIPADRGVGFGVFDSGGPDGDAAKLAKALKAAATSSYGVAGPEFVRRIIAQGADNVATTVREAIVDFTAGNVKSGSDGQIDRAAQRLGLIAAAGELAAALGVVPWQPCEARNAAAWALAQWIEGRGGTEPAEVRQAIEQVRLFIEQHGESRFEPLDDVTARPVNNRAGWRKGSGPDREWMIPPEVWKLEICNGLDSKLVARTLAGRGMLLRAGDGFQPVQKIDGANKRVYILTASIFDGGENGG